MTRHTDRMMVKFIYCLMVCLSVWVNYNVLTSKLVRPKEIYKKSYCATTC